MNAANLIQQLGQLTGIDLKLGAQGTLALTFEAGPTLHLEHDSAADVLRIYAVLGQEPADSQQRAALHRHLVAANAFGRKTGGAALGLDEATGDIVLAQCLVLDHTDALALRAAIETLVPVAARWQQQLAKLPAAAAPKASADKARFVNFGQRV